MSTAQPGSRSAPFQIAEEKYSASVVADAQGTRVVFRGTISTPNPAVVINPFVDAIHDELVKSGAKEVYIDFRDLEFCNSSGFKSFIHWIQKLQELPEAQRYGLRFMSNAARKWQRTSLLALSCYGVNSVTIQ
ncbi:STAS domain-containing protein [Anaeromyxobacter oryzae]|uniref:STAS domain-containing protein n=1 Tax=Anaeromyxobacter oryzae TaxID=2918170 RepID=A0ABM7WYM4_9BACT|nr:hypothetical protein [Anaeromyxobacter oryzae]BDG04608.1 hypothetical protein AMOR_36040 [Anaeromyxobacter oryzae]